MDNSTIGIKVADGTYFPILEEERTGKKKLVLTTVNDDQASVQIDLYKGEGQELNDALYIGSLVIEDIMPAMKGDPEIELLIGIDSDGNLNAEAGDTATSERQSLSVSLESLDDGDFSSPNFELDDQGFDEIPSLDEEPALDDGSSFDEEPAFDDVASLDEEPAFDDGLSFDEEPAFDDVASFDEEPAFDDGLSFDEEPAFDDVASFDEEPAFDDGPSFDDEPTSDDGASEYPDEGRKKRGPLALIVLIILILAILGLGALLIIRGMSSDSIPPLEADNNPTVTEPEDLQPAEPEPEPIIIAEAEPEPPAQEEAEPVDEVGVEMESPAAVSYDTVPPAGHGGGVWYRLKWGDTLWDLSSSFYRTPWLYGLIAVENGIKNPDIIYAGTDILIPEN